MELKSVAHLDIFHGNDDRVVTVGKEGCRVENRSSPTRPHKDFESRLENVLSMPSQDMSAILHFSRGESLT